MYADPAAIEPKTFSKIYVKFRQTFESPEIGKSVFSLYKADEVLESKEREYPAGDYVWPFAFPVKQTMAFSAWSEAGHIKMHFEGIALSPGMMSRQWKTRTPVYLVPSASPYGELTPGLNLELASVLPDCGVRYALMRVRPAD